MVLLPLLPGGEDLYNVRKIVQLTNVPAQVFIFFILFFYINVFSYWRCETPFGVDTSYDPYP